MAPHMHYPQANSIYSQTGYCVSPLAHRLSFGMGKVVLPLLLLGLCHLALTAVVLGAEPDWYDWFGEDGGGAAGSSNDSSVVSSEAGTGMGGQQQSSSWGVDPRLESDRAFSSAAASDSTSASNQEASPASAVTGQSAVPEGVEQSNVGAGTTADSPVNLSSFSTSPSSLSAATATATAAAAAADAPVTPSATSNPSGVSAQAPSIHEEVVEEPAALSQSFHRPMNSWEFQPSLNGGVGPLRLKSAFLAPARVLGIGLWTEYLSRDDMVIKGDSVTRIAGTLSMVYSPFQYLELGMGIRSYGVDNSLTNPQFLVAAGDFRFSAYTALPINSWLAAGAGIRADLPNNVGESGYNFQSISYAPSAIISADLRRLRFGEGDSEADVSSPGSPKPATQGVIPLRLHANAGFLFDNSSKLADRNFSLAEQYSMGVNRFDMVTMGAGLELIPIEWLAPFAEWHLQVPVETRSSTLDVCVPELPCPGDSQIGYASFPHWLSFGVKITPVQGVSLSAAVDLGLTEKVASGIASIPPYNYLIGFSYMPDAKDRVIVRNITRTVESTVPVVAASAVHSQAKLRGTVVDAATMERIAGAIIVYQDDTQFTPQATSADGVFVSYSLSPGSRRFDIGLPGQYKVGRFQVDIPKSGVVELAFPLEPESSPMEVLGRVYGPDDEAVSNGKVTFIYDGGPSEEVLDTQGRFQTTLLPGTVRVQVIADGYLAVEREFVGQAGDKIVLDLALGKAETPSVELVDKEIVIRKPIHFETGQARIRTDSYNVLDQVMDAMVRHQVKRLRVSGHTDSVGGEEINQSLSTQRAEAVKAYLVERGIAANRIEALGYGMSQPIAPNITAQGRALNRRVEFFVLD